MSVITLKPLDDGQKAVEIPLGKTTIGRGPLLGCSDKKVSRNHAVLEVTNKGEVYLTPTHVNPCFYQPTADSPGQILKKDVPFKLENGDSFSLLPRAYRYQLIVESEPNQNENTEENDNKELGKTNGSAIDLHEEAAAHEEFGDTIVPEKPFNKEEVSNSEKNCVKEDNSLSDIKDNGGPDFAKVSQEIVEPVEKAKGNSALDTELSVSDKCEKLSDKSDVPTVRTDVNDLTDADTSEKPPVDKINEENDLTLNVESNSKTSVLEGEDKSLVDTKLSIFEEKEESHPDEEPDEAISEDHSSKETELPPDKTSSVKTNRKTKTTKKPQKERQAPKRKAVSEAPAKPRGRKKANKNNFDGGEGSVSQRPGRTSSRTNRQTRQGLSLEDFIVSDDDEWQSDRSEPKPRRKRGGRRNEDSGSDWEIEHKKPKKSLQKVLSGSESGSERGNQRKRKGLKGKRKKSNSEVNEILSEEDEPQASSSHKEKEDKPRIPCKYGKKCYRRHPNHRNQFSHPGESDYTSETEEIATKNNDEVSESDGESPKKECPFGVNCFRKNPQHKKDFKHTKKVRPQREAAKQADKKAKSSRNSDEVDSYDLNDSFLNDDSDEYKPVVDSGSDYESGEKVKKLTKGVKRGKKA